MQWSGINEVKWSTWTEVKVNFIHFILLSFATWAGLSQQHVPITVGLYCLDMLILGRQTGVPKEKPLKHRRDQLQKLNLHEIPLTPDLVAVVRGTTRSPLAFTCAPHVLPSTESQGRITIKYLLRFKSSIGRHIIVMSYFTSSLGNLTQT